MEEVKEKLTDTSVEVEPVEKSEEDNVEDYFNPFADVKEEVTQEAVQEPVEGKEGVEDKKEAPVASDELREVKATVEAQRTVGKYVRENPMYADFADEITDMAAKAMVRNVENPIEFAIRNIKSPSEWIEIGRKSGIEDAGTALKSRFGGSSLGKSSGKGEPDYMGMSKEDFEILTRSVVNRA